MLEIFCDRPPVLKPSASSSSRRMYYYIEFLKFRIVNSTFGRPYKAAYFHGKWTRNLTKNVTFHRLFSWLSFEKGTVGLCCCVHCSSGTLIVVDLTKRTLIFIYPHNTYSRLKLFLKELYCKYNGISARWTGRRSRFIIFS